MRTELEIRNRLNESYRGFDESKENAKKYIDSWKSGCIGIDRQWLDYYIFKISLLEWVLGDSETKKEEWDNTPKGDYIIMCGHCKWLGEVSKLKTHECMELYQSIDGNIIFSVSEPRYSLEELEKIDNSPEFAEYLINKECSLGFTFLDFIKENPEKVKEILEGKSNERK